MQVRVSHLCDGNASPAANTGVHVQQMSFGAGFSAERTSDLVADGNDDVVLYVHRVGRRIVSQLGRETEIAPGGGVAISNAAPSNTVVPGPSRFVCIAVPRKPLTTIIRNLDDLLVQPLAGSAGVLQLLDNYLSVLQHGEAASTPELRHAIKAHIHDLVAVALGAARDYLEIASGRGIRAARLHAIRADIVKHFAEGDVSAGALAARHRVSPRYIHKLFEREGTTLSQYVLGQRLSQVHRMLTDPRNRDQTIGALAYSAGFGDLSTFNHAFRRQLGATPSDVRALARREQRNELCSGARRDQIGWGGKEAA
jgi:AraC-like DNA-binding protein